MMSRSPSTIVRSAMTAAHQGRILNGILSRSSSSRSAAAILPNVAYLHQFNPQLWSFSERRETAMESLAQSAVVQGEDRETSNQRGDVIYSLSFVKDATSIEHDYYTTAADFFLPCTPLMRKQLNNVVPDSMRRMLSMQDEEDRLLQQEGETNKAAPSPSTDFSDLLHLPRTVAEVLENALDPRAIVITEAVTPFRITYVNDAWVQLCGYCPEEAVGEPIGELLRQNALAEEENESPEGTLTAALVHVVLRGEAEAGAVVTNFTAEGRQFRNRLRIGPLTDDGSRRGRVTHFVGVLKEVQA